MTIFRPNGMSLERFEKGTIRGCDLNKARNKSGKYHYAERLNYPLQLHRFI